MLKKYPSPLYQAALFSLLSFSCTTSSLANTGTVSDADKYWLDSITLGFGYSRANSTLSEINGGVTGVSSPAVDGKGMSATFVLSNPVLPGLLPYVDITNLIQDDRDFLIPSIGLRYYFGDRTGRFQPFLSAGAGYVYAEWNESPVVNVTATEPTGSSFGLNLVGGLDISVAEHLFINLSARYDSYDIGTTVVENSKVTTINDKSSISALVGLSYRFGKKPLKDSDRDGVADIHDKCPDTPYGALVDNYGCALDGDKDGVIDLYDRCPDTLANVPVSPCGCPPWKFEFNLELQFDKFRIADYQHKPAFDPIAFLNKHPAYHIRVTGHTDSTGDPEYNRKLSVWRANEVKQFLVDRGIAEDRIRIRGKGDTEPLAENLTREGRATNRRIFIEIFLTDRELTTDILPIPPKQNKDGQDTQKADSTQETDNSGEQKQ